MSSTPYLEDLAGRLRDGGVPAERVAGMLDELAGYLAEAGTGPEEEFGPVDAFAGQLTAAASRDGAVLDAPGPSGADESWAFHAARLAREPQRLPGRIDVGRQPDTEQRPAV
jgi:hypothetical protein